jgi:hypothetical protein
MVFIGILLGKSFVGYHTIVLTEREAKITILIMKQKAPPVGGAFERISVLCLQTSCCRLQPGLR